MSDQALREHLKELLDGGHAHVTWKKALEGLSAKLRGERPEGAEHSAWELLEHVRLAQWDILEFSRDPKHVSPDWPLGYWPNSPEPPSAEAWDETVKKFEADTKAMQKLVADPKTDLFAKIPHGTGQTVLREAMMVADHNAYHLGQFVLVRRLLGAWPET
jgi:hypothetical protein